MILGNRTDTIGQYTIYPYMHSFSNLPNREAMLRPVKIPDVLPSALPPSSNFSLVAGTITGRSFEYYGFSTFQAISRKYMEQNTRKATPNPKRANGTLS